MPTTLARLEELRAEAIADDLAIEDRMLSWTEAQAAEYFESGGAAVPIESGAAAVPAPPAARRVTRLYALSDLHWDFVQNRKWLEGVADGSHMDDALVIAGDVTHKTDQFEDCLRTLKRKFGVVIFVPGNHDVWIRPDVGADFATSIDKLEWCLSVCERLGVQTGPTRVAGDGGAVWVVPLHSWYHHAFDGKSTAESLAESRKGFVDFNSCTWPRALEDEKAREKAWADRNLPSVEGRAYDAPVITASHFLPRPELMPPRKSWGRQAYICDAVGSHLIEEQLRRIGAVLHIFGHTHISWDAYHDGVHYLQNAVRYPHERIAWKSRVDEIQHSGGDLRNILVWSSSDAANFCPWPGRCGKCALSAPPGEKLCPPSRVAVGGVAVTADAPADPGRLVRTLPGVAGYEDDNERHAWARVPLPLGWRRTFGSGSLRVRWRDQGWGSQKGLIWAKLVEGDGAAPSPWSRISTHLAPQRWAQDTFRLPSAWFDAKPAGVDASGTGGVVELAYVVGSKDDGTGHQLQVEEGGLLVLDPRDPASASVDAPAPAGAAPAASAANGSASPASAMVVWNPLVLPPPSQVKLHLHPATAKHGKTDPIRAALAEAGWTWSEEATAADKAKELGGNLTNNLPMLQFDGQCLTQQTAILRAVGRWSGLYPTHTHTLAEVGLAADIDTLISACEDMVDLFTSSLFRRAKSESDKLDVGTDGMLSHGPKAHVQNLLRLLGSRASFTPPRITIADLTAYTAILIAKKELPATLAAPEFAPLLSFCLRIEQRPNMANWLAAESGGSPPAKAATTGGAAQGPVTWDGLLAEAGLQGQPIALASSLEVLTLACGVGRPALLQALKENGVARLADRQKLAGVVSKAVKAGRPLVDGAVAEAPPATPATDVSAGATQSPSEPPSAPPPPMDLTLYYWPSHGRGEMVRLILSESGLSWKQPSWSPVDDDDARLAYFAKCRTMGGHLTTNLPMLNIDGRYVTQTASLLRYLGRRLGLYPRSVEGTAALLACWRIDQLIAAADELRDLNYGAAAGISITRAFYARSTLHPHLANFARLLADADYFAGDGPSVADFTVYDVLVVAEKQTPGVLAKYPTLLRFRDRVAARPGVAAWNASDMKAAMQAEHQPVVKPDGSAVISEWETVTPLGQASRRGTPLI